MICDNFRAIIHFLIIHILKFHITNINNPKDKHHYTVHILCINPTMTFFYFVEQIISVLPVSQNLLHQLEFEYLIYDGG